MLVSGIFLVSDACAKEHSGVGDEVHINGPQITLRSAPEVTDESLRLQFEIVNTSLDDIWICESMDAGYVNFEAIISSDGEALIVRRRLDVFWEIMTTPPEGCYARLGGGESRKEVLSLSLPVCARRILTSGSDFGRSRDATRLILEVGYHKEDLSREVRTRAFVNMRNESVNRGEEALIPYHQFIENENVLRLTENMLRLVVEDLHIPYVEDLQSVGAPDGISSTRLDVQFKPSALAFLFPYVNDQTLLNAGEQERLGSLTHATISDSAALRALAEDLRKALDGAFFCEDATASLTFYRDGNRVQTFVMDEDASLISETGQVFRYDEGLRSIRGALAGVRSLDLRIGCAHNLEDLWCRLHPIAAPDGLVSTPAEDDATTYPVADRWCDAVIRPYQKWDRWGTGQSVKPFRCPAVSEGKCHYAMNPNCGLDSASDMVLLFETKAGWNQHGGLELFTFDNHDPKGGCVLLNDGTVKFIRSEEELHALRWK
jgi:hypothetical protein